MAVKNGSQAFKDTAEMQQSEGNILETAAAGVTGRKGNNEVGARRHLQELLEDELNTVNSNFKKLDYGAGCAADKVRLFAASNTDGGDSVNMQLAGKKRIRCGNLAANDSDEYAREEAEGPKIVDDEDSLVTDNDLAELGDEDFFYRNKGLTSDAAKRDHSTILVQLQQQQQGNNTYVKLNKQEEEALIRELESEAMGNDTLKELDEALMDRTTA